MIYLFYGQNDFSLHQAVAELKAGLGDPAWVEMNTSVLEAKTDPAALEEACRSLPLFIGQRLIMVSGLLARFEPRRGRSEQPPEMRSFISVITAVPETSLLLLIEERVSANNPLFQALKGKATIRQFAPLRGRELHQWIEERVKQGGGTITSGAVRLLAQMVGDNLWSLCGEIEKLLLYSQGKLIREETVERVVGAFREASIFRVGDALLQGRAAHTSRGLHQLQQEGMAPALILVRLAGQLRLIVQAKELLTQMVSAEEIGAKLGISHPYALKQTLDQARAHSFSRLEEAYRWLLDTDLAIKTGRWEEGLALDFLVAGLCPG